jgi:hypothetical protein
MTEHRKVLIDNLSRILSPACESQGLALSRGVEIPGVGTADLAVTDGKGGFRLGVRVPGRDGDDGSHHLGDGPEGLHWLIADAMVASMELRVPADRSDAAWKGSSWTGTCHSAYLPKKPRLVLKVPEIEIDLATAYAGFAEARPTEKRFTAVVELSLISEEEIDPDKVASNIIQLLSYGDEKGWINDGGQLINRLFCRVTDEQGTVIDEEEIVEPQ